MHLIEMLEQKCVASAAKSSSKSFFNFTENLFQFLQITKYFNLVWMRFEVHQQDIILAASLEKLIAVLVERHASHVRIRLSSAGLP